ncbi:hypothetical protein GCM10023238_18710 [Streptomyces heliomycini]
MRVRPGAPSGRRGAGADVGSARGLGPAAPAGAPDAGRGPSWPPGFTADPDPDPDAARRAAIEARAGRMSGGGADTAGGLSPVVAPKALDSAGDVRAARAGAIAAYRAGTRAAARVQEAQQNGRAALPGARPAPEDGGPASAPRHGDGSAPPSYAPRPGTRARPPPRSRRDG